MLISSNTFIKISFHLITLSFCRPPLNKTKSPNNSSNPKQNQKLGLFYDEYLKTIAKVFNNDPKLREELVNYDIEQLKNGEINIDFSHLSPDLKEHLDTTKRKEVERIRWLMRAAKDIEKGRQPNHKELLRQVAGHIDTENPHIFTIQDLRNVIKTSVNDLENFEEERHERFKRYELYKKAKEEERLSKMSDDERDDELQRLKSSKKLHNDHEPMNHPGSKKQFEEVWENEDEMVDEEFDPKTFFALHDTNSDGNWDYYEVEAMMTHELNKVYNPENPEDDMIEMEEEKSNMREHIFKEIDINPKDGMISKSEFLSYSTTKDFEKPQMDSYETVDKKIDRGHVFSKDELAEYKAMIKEHEEQVKKSAEMYKNESKSLNLEKLKYNQELNAANMAKEQNQTDDHTHNKTMSILMDKNIELNKRQQVLTNLSQDIKTMVQDLIDMKKDYASNVLQSPEMKETVERLELEKQQKIKQAQEKLDERKKQAMGIGQEKIDEYLKKQREIENKLKDMQHSLL